MAAWDGMRRDNPRCTTMLSRGHKASIYIYYVHTWKVPDLEETRRIQLPKCRSIQTTRLMTDTGAMTLLNSRGAVARRRQRDKVTNCPIDHEAKKSVSVGMKRDLSLTAIKTIQSALWIEPRTDWLDLNKFGGWTRSDETSLVTYNMLPQAWSLPHDEKVTAKYWREKPARLFPWP